MLFVLRLALEPLLSRLFDTHCVVCDDRQPDALCAACRAQVTAPAGARCTRCDHPLASTLEVARSGDACPDCRRLGVPAFESVVSAGAYDGVLRDAVLALKYHDGWRAAEPLAALMAARVRRAGLEIDAVVPVPIDAARQAARGYSQSLLLGARVAVRLGVPIAPALLRRRVAGVVQGAADRMQRHRQLAGVFEADPSAHLRGRRLLLVDDVMTTAATMHEAAAALRDRGARVWGVVAARQLELGGVA